MYQIIFYVPESHLELVKMALFEQGAGRIGPYRHCAWQTKGTGQFLAEEGSQPFSGDKKQLEHEEEFKVEMVCEDKLLPQILTTLCATHPYEQPAYSAFKILTLDDVKSSS